jgi:hypothetical protein
MEGKPGLRERRTRASAVVARVIVMTNSKANGAVPATIAISGRTPRVSVRTTLAHTADARTEE